jgi:hypothetical protein
MSLFAKRVAAVSCAVAVAGLLIALYVVHMTAAFTTPAAAVPSIATSGSSLTLETVPTIGPRYSPAHPEWVSYLAQTRDGQWVQTTTFNVPANAVVHVTVLQYDDPGELRNPFFSRVQGTIGGTETVNGQAVSSIPPSQVAHTFAVPELGLFVPLPGVTEDEDEDQNACKEAPCEPSNSHEVITFSFRTGKKGRYRWQCFVPCGLGTIDGNGGPMQTLGYMAGFLDVT